MKFVFVSNFLNHHQTNLCEELRRHCEEFHFIEMRNFEGIGFQKRLFADYVIRYEEEKERAETLIQNADVVMFGECENSLIQKRLSQKKLTFLFSERLFKKGIWQSFIPRTRKKILGKIKHSDTTLLYVLCASAYLPFDLSLFHFPTEKCLKWGYFPEMKKYNDILQLIKEKEENTIIWAGRLIKWKHPDTCIKLAKKLKKNGYSFRINLIGGGPMENILRKKISQNHLENQVFLLGAKTPNEVREQMEKSSIFLFSSDRKEGWGAVLNEAMNSGCAVVASHAAGAVPFLINNEGNGLIYRSGDNKDLYEKVAHLLDDKQACERYGLKAYETVLNEWCAQEAANRLIEMSKGLLNGEFKKYEENVCSQAPIRKEDCFGKRMLKKK